MQNRAIGCFLGIHKYVLSLAAQGDMGWIPGTIRRKCDMIRLWYSLINMSDDRIIKKVFLWNKVQDPPWAAEIHAVVEEADFQYIYRNNLSCSIDKIRKKLLVRFNEKWINDLMLKLKLQTYVQIKHNYETELYVKTHLPRNQRSLIAH